MTSVPSDLTALPARMTTRQVCALAGCSASRLARQRREDPDWLPASPVQLGRSTMFDRDAVLKALRLVKDEPTQETWTADPDAIRRARARNPSWCHPLSFP